MTRRSHQNGWGWFIRSGTTMWYDGGKTKKKQELISSNQQTWFRTLSRKGHHYKWQKLQAPYLHHFRLSCFLVSVYCSVPGCFFLFFCLTFPHVLSGSDELCGNCYICLLTCLLPYSPSSLLSFCCPFSFLIYQSWCPSSPCLLSPWEYMLLLLLLSLVLLFV